MKIKWAKKNVLVLVVTKIVVHIDLDEFSVLAAHVYTAVQSCSLGMPGGRACGSFVAELVGSMERTFMDVLFLSV